ncbi:MAG: HDOD domain-containing protein [Candidatus Magnetoovum sp. WYHC-5]|nr:HDOD domain-containing protein [Candidatus Magnetoovum sp. WYHC-5]
MTEDKKKEIIKLVEKMPAFPKSVQRVLEMTSDINCSPRELVAVIEHDPVLVMKILKTVNSAYFGLASKITSINHAVVYLGLNAVKNIALTTVTIGMLPRSNSAGFDTNGFLLHCILAATISKLVAKKQRVPHEEIFDYFLTGLLHDIGKVVFLRFMPEKFKKALELAKDGKQPLHKIERKIIGIDHAQMGYFISARWNLPKTLGEAIRHHHDIIKTDSKKPLHTDYVYIANQLCKKLQAGYSGNFFFQDMPNEMKERFGMGLDEIWAGLEDLDNEIEKSKNFSIM